MKTTLKTLTLKRVLPYLIVLALAIAALYIAINATTGSSGSIKKVAREAARAEIENALVVRGLVDKDGKVTLIVPGQDDQQLLVREDVERIITDLLDGKDVTLAEPGADGEIGTDGTNGVNGSDGASGTNGADGVSGSDGATGAAGAKGDTGATGAGGAKGDTGAAGAKGEPGTVGKDGEPGADGAAGKDGEPGAAGKDGEPGVAGTNGKDGANITSVTLSITNEGKLQIEMEDGAGNTTSDTLDLGLDEYLTADDMADFVTSGALDDYATEDYVDDALTDYATEDYVDTALDDYAMADDVDELGETVEQNTIDIATNTKDIKDLKDANYVTPETLTSSLSTYTTVTLTPAITTALSDYTANTLKDYVLSSTLNGYSTTAQMDTAINTALSDYTTNTLSNYVLGSALSGYVTTSTLTDYSTTAQMSTAITNALSTANYATTTQLNELLPDYSSGKSGKVLAVTSENKLAWVDQNVIVMPDYARKDETKNLLKTGTDATYIDTLTFDTGSTWVSKTYASFTASKTGYYSAYQGLRKRNKDNTNQLAYADEVLYVFINGKRISEDDGRQTSVHSHDFIFMAAAGDKIEFRVGAPVVQNVVFQIADSTCYFIPPRYVTPTVGE
jgi:hypothetical protein